MVPPLLATLTTASSNNPLTDSDRLSFEQFIEWYPEDGRCYELYRGFVTYGN